MHIYARETENVNIDQMPINPRELLLINTWSGRQLGLVTKSKTIEDNIPVRANWKVKMSDTKKITSV
jgi:hypothetical protein